MLGLPQEISPWEAQQILRNAGAKTRMSGGGLAGDPKPQIEAKPPGGEKWQYVAQITEEKVRRDAVFFWIDQNIVHQAHPAP